MQVPEDNAAGRLHRVLSGLKNHPGNQSIESALRDAIGLTDADTDVELHEYVAQVVRWPREAQDLIRALPDENHDLLLQWVPAVDDALIWAGRWAHTVNNLQGQFDGTTLYSLAITADLLHRRFPQPTIDDDGLTSLVEMVTAMIDEVTASADLPEPAKVFLSTHLVKIYKALVHFRIVGYEGILSVLDTMLGSAIRNPEVQVEQTTSVLGRFWSELNSVLIGTKQLSDTATAAAAAIEAGHKLIS